MNIKYELLLGVRSMLGEYNWSGGSRNESMFPEAIMLSRELKNEWSLASD